MASSSTLMNSGQVLIAGAFFSAFALVIHAQQPQPTSTPAPTTSKSIRVKVAGEEWEFSAAPDGDGLLVGMHGAGGSTEVRVGAANPGIGRVVDFVVSAWEYRQNFGVVGVGVAAQRKDAAVLEYYMFQNLRHGRTPDRRDVWTPCGPLISRPIDSPFEAMSVGLPEGDSIYLSLQDLTRADNRSRDRIESHIFVNHCPASTDAEVNRLGTRHYESLSEYPPDGSPTPPPPSSAGQ